MVKTKPKVRFRVVIVFLLILAGGYTAWRLLTTHERLKDYARTILKEQFAGRVKLERVSVGVFSGVEIKDFQVLSRRQPGRVLLHIGVLRLHHSFPALLRGRIVIDELEIENPTLFALRKANGEWEVEDIFRFRSKHGYANLKIYSVIVRDAAFRLHDERAAELKSDLLDISRLDAVALAAPGERGKFLLRGGIERSVFGSLQIAGSLDLKKNSLEALVTREQLPLDENTSKAISPFLPDSLKPLCFQGGLAELKFTLLYDGSPGGQIDYASKISLRAARATIGSPKLPVTDLQGEVEVGRDVVVTRGLMGLLCGAPFTMKGTVARNPERASTDLTVAVNDFMLDQNLTTLSESPFASICDQMKLAGGLDIQWRLASPPGAQKPAQSLVRATLKACSLTSPVVPQPITDLSGIVEYRDNKVFLKGITGRTLGATVLIEDVGIPADSQSSIDIPMHLPGVTINDKFISQLPENMKTVLGKYRATGKADLHCRLSRAPGARQKLSLSITADCQDLQIAYPLLKEPFEHLRGRIRFTDAGLVIESAHGFCGRRPVTLTDVRMDSLHPNPLSGTVNLRNWRVDDELKSFVPEKLRPIVDDLQAEGVVDVDYKIRPPTNGKQPPPEMALTIHDGRVKSRPFPYEVRNIEGRLILADGSLRIEGMVAHDGDAMFVIPDRTFNTSGHDTLTIQIIGKNLPLDPRLRDALSEQSRQIWDLFSPKGKINADIRIDSIPNRKTPVVTAIVDCNGSQMTYQPFPYTVRDVHGTMVFTEDGVRLKGVSGKPPSGLLTFADTTLYFDRTKGMTFHIEGQDLRFDDDLYKCLPDQFKTTWKTIDPQGAFDLTWHQERKPGNDPKYNYNVTLTLKGCNMKYASLPYMLTDLKGTLRYDGENVRIEDVKGKSGQAQFTILGKLPDPTGGTGLNLTVTGDNVSLDDKLRAVLPASYYDLLDKVKPGGHISFTSVVNYRTDDKGKRVLEYEIPTIELKNCSLTVEDVSLTGIEGIISANGEVRDMGSEQQKSWTQGYVELKSATLDKMKYEAIRATFFDETLAFHVPYLEATCYGGKVAGSFSIEKGSPLEEAGYQAEFRAENVSAAEIIAQSGLPVKGVEGTIFAETKADGRGFQTDALKAQGTLNVTKGKMGELPHLLGLLKKSGGLPSSVAFTDANLKYKIKDKQALIEEADLLGPALSLRGKGKIAFNGELEMEFRPELGP
jgi:hypothetical protein